LAKRPSTSGISDGCSSTEPCCHVLHSLSVERLVPPIGPAPSADARLYEYALDPGDSSASLARPLSLALPLSRSLPLPPLLPPPPQELRRSAARTQGRRPPSLAGIKCEELSAAAAPWGEPLVRRRLSDTGFFESGESRSRVRRSVTWRSTRQATAAVLYWTRGIRQVVPPESLPFQEPAVRSFKRFGFKVSGL